MMTTIRKRVADFVYPEGTEERRSLERQINIDPLTGLGNRRAFMLALPFAELDPDTEICVFDMDNFGKVNKIEGHSSGDVLKKLAAEFIGRYPRSFCIGGDEFVILCNEGEGRAICDAVENLFGKFTLGDGTVVSITGTSGSTFKEADRILQRRKSDRKGRS